MKNIHDELNIKILHKRRLRWIYYFLLTSFKYYTPLFEECSWFHLVCLLSFLLFFKERAEFVFCEWFWQKRLWNSYTGFWKLQKMPSCGYKNQDAVSIQIYEMVLLWCLIVIYFICKWRLWKIKLCF